jgi:hypothetical protein
MAGTAAGTIPAAPARIATLAESVGTSAAFRRRGHGGNELAVRMHEHLRANAERTVKELDMMTVRTLVPTLDRVLSMNRELDRVFTRNFGNPGTWLLDVPGVSHEAIDLTFDQGALTIRGMRGGTEYGDQDKIYVGERTLGDFERVVRLPETVDADRIQASFDRGVVTILIPKAATARARKIAISTNGHHV